MIRLTHRYLMILLGMTQLFFSPLGIAALPDEVADQLYGQGDFSYGVKNRLDGLGVDIPGRIALDHSVNPNRVYLSDTQNNRVLAWEDVANFRASAVPDMVFGQPDAYANSCNNGGASADSLCDPNGVAVDANGNLYIADQDNNRVLRFDAPFSDVSPTTADLVFGQSGDFSDVQCHNTGLNANSLCAPHDVAADASGNLYVADWSNHRVLRFNVPAVDATPTTADMVFGQGGDFTQGACNAGGLSADSLCEPYGIATDTAGNLYVADQDNNRALGFNNPSSDATPTTADLVFGQGGDFTANICRNGGLTADSLCFVYDVATDSADGLYVVDHGNHRVLRFADPANDASPTTADTVFGQNGSFSTNQCHTSPPTQSNFCQPHSVDTDAAGNLFVVDQGNHRVLSYLNPLTDDIADHVFGQGSFQHRDANRVDSLGVSGPWGVAIDFSTDPNRIYLSDTDNHRVLAWASIVDFRANAAADLIFGQPDAYSTKCNNGGRSADSICNPVGLAVDSQGNFYVADKNNHRVLGYNNPFTDATPTTADRVFGKGGSFVNGGCNAGGLSADSLCTPYDVAVNAADTLYIADYDNQRILGFVNPISDATPTTADEVFGQGGSFTDRICNNGGISSASLCQPISLAIDPNGKLYVADLSNQRVLGFNDPATDATPAVADQVFGQGGDFSSNTCNKGGRNADSLCNPFAVASDVTGNLFVADTTNSRVLGYNNPGSDATPTTADMNYGHGGSLTAGGCNIGGRSATSLCSPRAVATDSAGNLYVADRSNNRVVSFGLLDLADFGDAPTAAQSGFAQSYPTTLAQNGAVHALGLLHMGPTIDSEEDGQPNATATGDDVDAGANDEDGSGFADLITGSDEALIGVQSSIADTGFVNAWMDFNQDGDWEDANEKIVDNQPVNSSLPFYYFSIPATATPGTTYARVRLSTAGGDGITGLAADGEVEDHQIVLINGQDNEPNAFTFIDKTDVALNKLQPSNAIRILGTFASSPISITGGEYYTSATGWTSAAGNVAPGAVVKVRHTSSSSYNTQVDTTLTIGGISDTFSSTTSAAPAADSTPDAFSFTDKTDVEPSKLQNSNMIRVKGTNVPASISITGGEYYTQATGWTTASGTIGPNEVVKVRHSASDSPATQVDSILSIGGVSDTFSSTTAAAGPDDSTPDAFSFTDKTNVAQGKLQNSNVIRIKGTNVAASISIAGGEYYTAATGWTSTPGTIQPNAVVKVRHTSAVAASTTVNTELTIGGVSDTFSSTTAAAP